MIKVSGYDFDGYCSGGCGRDVENDEECLEMRLFVGGEDGGSEIEVVFCKECVEKEELLVEIKGIWKERRE